MSPLVIVDPALGRTGAHNQGFAELLVKQGAEPGKIGIWCSQSIETELRNRLGSSGVVINPVFSVNFYQIIGKEGGVAEHWDWIYRLATEYLCTLEQALDRWPGEPIRLLYHTMSWEHATALSLAIGLLGGRGDRLQHLVLLMYSPGIDESGTTFDAKRRLNFRLAFVGLARLPGVELHASCGEYADAYAALLGRAAPLPIHPCFLGDWRSRPERRPHGGPEQVLLYVGEVKQEKGFLSLPRIAAGLVGTVTERGRLIIQFVNVRNEAGKKVLDALTQLASSHQEIELHHGFWSDEKLHQVLAASSVFHLDYDAAAYAHKTSGLLWLAAWYGLPVAVPRNTWLEREARRLGLAMIPPGKPLAAENAVVDHHAFDEGYFRAVFMPFQDWLDSGARQPGSVRSSRVDTCAAEPAEDRVAAEVRVAQALRPGASAGARKPGADIVLFWKQNDTTLYGRRCDMVARYLASRADVCKVVVVDAPIAEAELARLADNRGDTRQERWIYARTLEKLRGEHDTAKLSHRVFVYPSAEFCGNENDGPSPRFLDRYVEFLGDTFAQEQVDPAQAVFWAYPRNLGMAHLIEHFSPARVVIDVVDDHRAWPGVSDETTRQLTENYKTLLGMADMALANCVPVQQSMQEFCPEIQLVPNGCDSDPPRVAPEMNAALDAFLAYPGRTIGYVGNLETKIDIDLLSRLAERFRDCQVVLIGSTHANPEVLELLRHPNVCLPGVVPYERLGAWLEKFDVGLIPHLDMALTRVMNPLKAYVYLSWGVPVVATAVPNVETGTDLICVADTHEQFLDQVARTLDSGRLPRQAFRDYVIANSWEARLARHVDALDLGNVAAEVAGPFESATAAAPRISA